MYSTNIIGPKINSCSTSVITEPHFKYLSFGETICVQSLRFDLRKLLVHP